MRDVPFIRYVALGALAGAFGLPASLGSQAVQCRATRSPDSVFRGTCTHGDSTVAHVMLREALPGSPYLLRGTAMLPAWAVTRVGARATPAEMSVDVRPNGALRLGRAWLAMKGVARDAGSLAFAFQFGEEAPATDIDLEILRRARAMLADSSRWNPTDSTNMDTAPQTGFACAPATRQSMFCALYLASVELAGDYAHFRPAVNAVRQAVRAASTRSYRHPLVDFNNDPRRPLHEVQAVLEAALAALQEERSRQGSIRPASRVPGIEVET